MPKIAIFLAIHVALFQQLTGINTIALYGGKIVKEVLPDLNKIIPIFTTLLPALTAAFTTELMKKYGRKTLLQFGDVLLIFALVLMCIGFAVEPHT
jgi:Na+/H+-dicarboxylate symporter